jgi:hypothetical protein
MSEPVGDMRVRDTLDEAVRCLAASASPLPERLRAAGSLALLHLSRADFVHSEDRELFDQIETSLTKLGTHPWHDPFHTSIEGMSDSLLKQVADEILALRDTIIGRAIREASLRAAAA